MTKCVNNSNCVGIIARRASAGFMYLLDITIISNNTYILITLFGYATAKLQVPIDEVILAPALDADAPGDAGQRAQDAAYGLHLRVHAVHVVNSGEPAQ